MSQLQKRVAQLEEQNRQALASQPSFLDITPETTREALAGLVAWREEIGCPYSDEQRARIEKRMKEDEGKRIRFGFS
jgi:hypothetical protein